jgi:hypothetical protein
MISIMIQRATITQLALSLLIITCAGCTPADAGTSLPPTRTPATAAVSAAVNTSTAIVIPTYTDTPAPEKVVLTFTKNAFCRKGPGTQYFDVGSFKEGDTTEAQGRNDTDPRWWYVLKSNGEHCWVSETTVQPNPAAEALPVQLPEKALPLTPPDLYADRICKPKKGGFAVTLNWTPSSNADGYYVYLNGEQIEDIKKPTQTSYVIKLPMNEPVSYAFEAYNSIGSGERLVIEDPGCP